MLDRADCADFGCHNSIRLETKHFLNTLALTFISFSGRFVFAMQKHYLFFCERSSSWQLSSADYGRWYCHRNLTFIQVKWWKRCLTSCIEIEYVSCTRLVSHSGERQYHLCMLLNFALLCPVIDTLILPGYIT